uniref:NADH dehydrogenase subunit 6 n=1 Tax=Siphonaria pectinata TaxID=57642 RepID=Q6VAQ3_9GAST|nr:NADH dehydrogenase subunit 6 [Siphonaria pectinata]AAR21548.1 NADH dehydrogenase subunit 6 [Siphonaria pectinata]
MFLLMVVCSFLLLTFPMYKNPASQGGVLVVISFYLVALMSLTSSVWFSYVLFLVYIGGLLVMFIYVCLVSSNYPFKLSSVQVISGLSMSLIVAEWMPEVAPSYFLGSSTWVSGAGLIQEVNVGLFLSLVVLLLFMLLVVVRSTGVGAVVVGT